MKSVCSPPRHLALAATVLVACSSPTFAEQWPPEQKLFASDAGIMDRFGEDVALDGERIAVGAPFDNGAASDGGAVYLFERQVDGSWREVVKLIAADTDANHHVGGSVALDGTTVAATAPGVLGSERHVHVFEESGGSWIEVATLVPPDGPDHDFGTDVALDGDTLLVGAELDIDGGANPGSVYVFERDAGGPGNWGPVAKLIPSDAPGGDRFGHSVDIDGDTLVGGARDHGEFSAGPGAAYVFERDGDGRWTEVAKLSPPEGDFHDQFGNSVAIHGDTIVIGTPGDDEQDNASGAIYIYERDAGGPGAWGQVRKLLKSDPFGGEFGWAVDLDADIVVGGTTGSLETVYLFQRNAGGPGRWGEVEKRELPDGPDLSSYGQAVALTDGLVAVGAPSDDEAAFSAGAAYVFAHLPLTLALSGTCPGIAEITVTAATPGNPVALLRAAGPGTSEVPGGPCAGTPLALDDPKVLGVVAADADGELAAERTLPESACGRVLEAVDLASCRTSGAVAVP